MKNESWDTSHPVINIESENSPLPGNFIPAQKPGNRKRQFIAPTVGFMFTSSPEVPVVEQIVTVKSSTTAQEWMQEDLSAVSTEIIPAIEPYIRDSLNTEQLDALQMMGGWREADTGDDDAIILETVSIRAVKKKQVKKNVSAVFSNIIVLCISILLLGLLAIAIILLSNPLYKAVVFLVSLVVLSYVVSAQVKFIYRARQKTFLTVTQMVRVVGKKSTLSKDKDMKHMTLIKQDTTAFLRAITKKDLRDDAR
ncbi:hypothetical protein KDH_61450 [Dictyobacter sp. S3.2.2.5]|uniref:Uncharacterized protein n=1 Tax=Dictyobacter halimunensis TaxID=3026934 RepID=A0ABQ6G2J4_9CHLR|nr:hypothetical protein KDH_61450 [Dictyobacter sp. S3.2.2.5]